MTPKLLFLAANPTNTDPLALGEEVNAIEMSLRLAKGHVPIESKHVMATGHQALVREFFAEKPSILHFSGHGQSGEGLVLHDPRDTSRTAAGADLARLFAPFNAQLKLVVLNACYSLEQATQMTHAVDVVIGMTTSIKDRLAREFASTLYSALANGNSVGQAVEAAKASVGLAGIPGDEAIKVRTRYGVDPYAVRVTWPLGAQSAPPVAVAESSPHPAQTREVHRDTVAIAPYPRPAYDALGLDAPALIIEQPVTTPAPWHKQEPPGSDLWAKGWQKLEAGLAQLQDHPNEIDVLASLPYSFGAAAGFRLVEMSCQPVYWQSHGGNEGRNWVRYGRAEKTLNKSILNRKAQIDADPSLPIVMTVSITHHIDLLEMKAGMDAAEIPDFRVIRVGPLSPSPKLLPDDAHARHAAAELADHFSWLNQLVTVTDEEAAQQSREVHLFYTGPIAVLMMAIGRMTSCKFALIVHERGGDELFRPAVCLFQGKATLLPGTVPEALRAQWKPRPAGRRFPSASRDSHDESTTRGVHGDLLSDDAYAHKKDDFSWLDWAMALVGGPVGVLKQLKMLDRYRARRVKLTDLQAKILLALMTQPGQAATVAILASSLGPRLGLTAEEIEAELVELSTARRADGAPADIVVRDGEKWRAIDL